MKIIKHVDILTMNEKREIIEDGVVAIEGNEIIFVGDNFPIEKYDVEEIIDGQRGILMPGMINTHTHVPMVAFRSLGDDEPDRLKKYIFPLEKEHVNQEMVSIASYYGIVEMIMGGVTTFADMYYFEDEVAKAAKSLGIRGVLGETVLNFPSPSAPEPYGGIEYSIDFIKKWLDDDLITATIAPHAPYTNETEYLVKAKEVADKFGVPMMMHVAEMPYETEKYKEEYNMSPVAYLDANGLLNKHFIAAHAMHVDEKDLNILKRNGVGIAHNMGANAKAGKGVAPVYEMRQKGIPVGLGTDGPMSGNTLDIITQLGLVAKIQKLHHKNRNMFPAIDIVEMATIGGAKVLNMQEQIGSIEVGKKADMVLIETESVNMQPIYDYYSVLTYSANPMNVQSVMINGQWVLKNRCLQTGDWSAIKNNFIKLHEKLKDVIK